LQAIADRLNDMQVPTSQKGKWNAKTVSRVLVRVEDKA
jgi:hypothetical protein